MNSCDDQVFREAGSKATCGALPGGPASDYRYGNGTAPHASILAGAHVRVLWIDDDVRRDDPLILAMTMDGILAEIATTGRDGIDLATGTRFDAILLDLRLPDMHGTAVLAALIGIGVRTPVIVLTGYGDVATCATAMKLGAVEFKEKPVSDVELTALIHSRCRTDNLPDTAAPPMAVYDGSACQSVAMLAVELLDLGLTPFQFLATATALRRGSLGVDEATAELAPGAKDNLSRIALALESELLSGRIPAKKELAESFGILGRAPWRDLSRQTSFSYRSLRTALRLRRTLPDLADRDERVSQVAYSIGYDHPGQYTRDFRNAFGMCPKLFRRLVRLGKAARSVNSTDI